MYKFYIGNILFPVAPAKIEWRMPGRNETLTLINKGEINIIKPRGLKEVLFETELPGYKLPYAYYENGFINPKDYIDKIQEIYDLAKPVIFRISRESKNSMLGVNNTIINTSIEDFSYYEEAGYGNGYKISIRLKEYKDFATVKIANGKDEVAARKTDIDIPKTYTVVKGDNLWNICKKYLNDGSKFGEIAKLNGISNPSLIYPGQVIRLG